MYPVQKSINSIRSKYNSLVSLKQKRHTPNNIDPMFFHFEDLPPFGKEYWFMKFLSTDPKDKRQLLTMLGRCTEDVRINGKLVKPGNISGKQSGFMNSWFYDKGKKIITEKNCQISVSPGKLIASEKNVKIEFLGKFPSYTLKLSDGNKKIGTLKIYKSKTGGESYHFESFFKVIAGFALINIYLNFTGMLNGKIFNGRCYLQKVIIIGPFVPWYWGRIIFENGSVLKYFMPKLELFGINHKLISRLSFYDSETRKIYEFKGLNVEKRDNGGFPQYLITDSENKIRVSINPYSFHKFLFEKLGTFEYNEYLSEVEEIQMYNLGVDVKKLGRGIGLVEETKGYVF